MERMSSWEFAIWAELVQREPFGYQAEMYRAGVIAATVANCAPRKKGAKPLKPSDFYPTVQSATRKRPDLTPEQEAHLSKKHGKRRNRHS